MQLIDDGLSAKIANVSFLCILLVVAQHIPHGAKINEAIGILTGIAVPFFFAVSGFFYAGHNGESGWWRNSLKRRVSTLIVPYVIFNSTWYVYLHHYELSSFNLISFLGADLSCLPPVGCLWYVRALLTYIIIFPLILKIANRSRFAMLLYFIGVFLLSGVQGALAVKFAPSRLSDFLRWGFPLYGLLWFSVGFFVRLRGGLPARRYQAVWAVACSMLCLTLYYKPLVTEKVVCCLARVFSTFCLLWLVWIVVGDKRLPILFTSAIFPIFCLHWQVINLVGALINKFHLNLCVACEMTVSYVFAISVPILISIFLRKYIPAVSTIIFGGR